MIRRYRPGDRDRLVAIWESASALAHPFLDPDFVVREREMVRSVHLAQAETWVWEAQGRISGFIALLGNEIGGLFVDPAHHREGIGRALVDHARRLHGALEVEVFAANALGRTFYAAYGFNPIAELIDPASGVPALRLRIGPAT